MTQGENIKTNVPEFSVSDLAFSLKKTLEDNFGRVRVRGEIGRVTIPGSGHLYTNLKDENATIDAVCWKGSVSKLSVKPEEGLEVICTGRITTYPASSKYQLIIESMELAGEGALLKMLEERKKKLAAEGLFAAERKRPLPFLPRTIGVITSPTGAVIRDILHRLADRFPRNVLLWPVLVQGEGAATQIAAAIEGFQTIERHGLACPDVLIVARGGGSLEDLMPFNEEAVVRAVAASQIPVISAVGHETDTTLCDYAADLRAPTPTGAAEMAVPIRAQLYAQVLDDEARLHTALNRQLSDYRRRVENSAARLGDPAKLLEIKSQKLDHLAHKLTASYSSYLAARNTRAVQLGAQLRHPSAILDRADTVLKRWGEQLARTAPLVTKERTQKIEHYSRMLEAYSFKNVLKRGYAAVYDKDGKPLMSAGETTAGQDVRVQFHDDSVDAVIAGGAKPPAAKKPKLATAKNSRQQTLF